MHTDIRTQFDQAKEDTDQVVLEGFHAVKHAWRFGATFDLIVTTDAHALQEFATEYAPDIQTSLLEATQVVSADTFHSLVAWSARVSVNIMAVARRRSYTLSEITSRPGPIIVLERPTHMGNIGSVIRVAAAADAAGVICIDAADPWHPAAIRGAAGLQFAVPVVRIDALADLPDRPVIVMDDSAPPIGDGGIPDRSIIAFGTELRGVSSELRQQATRSLSIPMKEGVSSLNLATSVAVVLYCEV